MPTLYITGGLPGGALTRSAPTPGTMTTHASSESDSDDGVRITIGPVRGPIAGSAAATDELARLDRLALDGFQADATAAAELEREVTELVRQSLQPTTTRIVVAHSRGQLLLVPEHTPISVRLATVAWGATRPYEQSTLPHQAVLQQTIAAAHCVNGATYADGFPRASEPPRTIAIFGARYEPTMCANFAVLRQPSASMAAPLPTTTTAASSASPLKLCRYHDFAVVIVRNGTVVDHAVHRTTSNVAECLNQHAPERVYYNATEGDPLDVFVRYRWQPFYRALVQCGSLRPRPLSRRSAPFCSVALCGPQTRTPSALGDCLEYLWDLVTALPAPTALARWPPPATPSYGRPYYRTPARAWAQRARHGRREYTAERRREYTTTREPAAIRKRTRSPPQRQLVPGTSPDQPCAPTMDSAEHAAAHAPRSRSPSSESSPLAASSVTPSPSPSTGAPRGREHSPPAKRRLPSPSTVAPSRHRRGRERTQSPPAKRRAVRERSASSTSSASPSRRRRPPPTVASEVHKVPPESAPARCVTDTLLRLADASRSSVGSSRLPRKRRGRRRRRPRRRTLPPQSPPRSTPEPTSSIHRRLGPIPPKTRRPSPEPSATRTRRRRRSRTRRQSPGTRRRQQSPYPARTQHSPDEEDTDTRSWRDERYRQRRPTR